VGTTSTNDTIVAANITKIFIVTLLQLSCDASSLRGAQGRNTRRFILLALARGDIRYRSTSERKPSAIFTRRRRRTLVGRRTAD
jgi:hypothetical protein